MDAVEPTDRDTVAHCRFREPGIPELIERHDAVLSERERHDRFAHLRWDAKDRYVTSFTSHPYRERRTGPESPPDPGSPVS
jgi:hypothetical protein